jgi:hypothetical protein
MYSLYLSIPSLICFGDDVEFTPEQQAKFNSVLAEEKRSYRAQLAKNERQLSELSEFKNLSEQEREQLRESLELTQQQLRSKEENEKIEKQKLDAKHKRELAEYKKRADEADSKYRDSTIRSALVDAAAAHGAYSNSILISVLQGDTSIADDGKVIVTLKAKDDDGRDTVLQMSPSDAVKWMKDRPETYGGLFADYVAKGGTPQPGANGRVDVRTLSVEQVRKLYKENPRSLGL